MNILHLDNLGPLAFALHWITKLAETNKSKKVTLGAKLHKPSKNLHHDLGSWCSSDLVFRGVQMKSEWIEDWKSSVGIKGLKNCATHKIEDEEKPAYINMQGITSTTESFRVALKQAQPFSDEMTTVVFIISLQNYSNTAGFRMDDQNYTAHISDKEHLLKDGFQMFVIGVDEQDIKDVDSEDQLYKDFDGKKLTLVHLCRVG